MTVTRRQLLSRLAGTPIAVMAALSLTGCVATAPVASPDPGDDAQPQNRVLIRVSAEGLKYLNRFALLVRPVKGGEPLQIQGWGMGSSGYWSGYYDEVEKGELVAVSLPAGDYEIYSFVAMASGWGSPRAVTLEKGFPSPFSFRLNEGETLYLGNLLVRFSGDSGVSSVRIGTAKIEGQRSIPYEPIARDTRTRDFKELESRFPGLKPDQVKVRLLK